jgi:hypothetical protein
MEFDCVTHRTRLVELIDNLQRHCAVQLLVTYSREKNQLPLFHNKIIYYSATKTHIAKRMTRHISQYWAFRSAMASFQPSTALLGDANPALFLYAVRLRRFAPSIWSEAIK